jgi:hypothetical protein
MSFEQLRSSEESISGFHSILGATATTETDRHPSITNTASKNYAFSRLQSCSSVSSASPSARIDEPRPMVFVCLVDLSPIWGYLYAKDRISIAQGLVGSGFLRPPLFLSWRSLITPHQTDESLGYWDDSLCPFIPESKAGRQA